MDNMYNLNIERGLLASVVFEPWSEDANYILDSVTSSDFYSPFHQHFFSTCLQLNKDEKPIEEEFIRGALIKENKFDEVAHLDIVSSTPITNIKAYVNELREKSQKRSLAMVASSIKKRVIEEDAAPLDVIEETIKRVENIAENGTVVIQRKSMAYAKEGEPEFICKDWLPIPKGTTSMLVAPGGTGKTWLALQLAIRMAREDAGRKIFLWLSEDPEGIVKSRYKAITDKILFGKKGTEDSQIDISTEDPLLLLEPHGRAISLSSKFYAMKRELREYDVIVIDPLLAFYGGDENDNSQARVFMQPFLNWARSENKSIIFLHHSKKGDSVNGSKARGAGAIVDAVRCVYDMDKVYVKKSDGKELDPLNLHMRKLTLSKDNYGASQFLHSFSVMREITPKQSARAIEIEYEDDGYSSSFNMPEIH